MVGGSKWKRLLDIIVWVYASVMKFACGGGWLLIVGVGVGAVLCRGEGGMTDSIWWGNSGLRQARQGATFMFTAFVFRSGGRES